MPQPKHPPTVDRPAAPGPTRIYVNRVALERNLKEGTDFPPITVRHPDGTADHGRAVEIQGPSRVIYDPAGLFDGARVWVETTAPFSLTT